MGRIRIELDLDPDWADEEHESGVTEEANDRLIDALNSFGDDVTITKVGD